MMLSRRAAGLSLAGGLKNTLKGGVRAADAPAAAVVWGRHGFVGLTVPDSALRHRSWSEPAAEKRACRPATARLSRH